MVPFLNYPVHPVITACAVATSSCISDVPSQWEGQNFDPPLLPHFSTDLNETQKHERYFMHCELCKFFQHYRKNIMHSMKANEQKTNKQTRTA